MSGEWFGVWCIVSGVWCLVSGVYLFTSASNAKGILCLKKVMHDGILLGMLPCYVGCMVIW